MKKAPSFLIIQLENEKQRKSRSEKLNQEDQWNKFVGSNPTQVTFLHIIQCFKQVGVKVQKQNNLSYYVVKLDERK